ncbi:DNA repair protein [Microthyrium microscopicum]|uniref:DNA repair protein n=1 Tax=Microthyrium microscopicum TaxID=703497 RepID=A0A6A6UCS2_9PEZI|nr:DNA repair protein [Microthyrium microscopicum]
MAEEEHHPVKLSLPLEFQQDIFQEIRAEDELLIIAKGLGLLRIVTNLLHSYDAAGNNLIIIVGANDRENGWIGEFLAEHATISKAPKARGLSLVNTQMASLVSRQKLYAHGGILSITSQILIVDLLSGVLPPGNVTGMVVLHAERVSATSIESFVLREYRQHNKVGFLKAFSDSPESFTYGFSPLATMMRNLFLQKTLLYPRFQLDVIKSLEGQKKAEVIELEVPMTESMATIQAAILECVEASVSDLKKGNTGLDMSDWNLDNALQGNFDQRVMRQLNPVWHRLHPRTKQVAADLRTLRSMLSYLVTFDPVQFLKYLDTVLAASQPKNPNSKANQSPWLFLDAATTIFETAKQRVYAGKMVDNGPPLNKAATEAIRPTLEELPKWVVLSEVLDEIERDVYFNPVVDDSSGSIMIMCSNHETCAQLKEYLKRRQLVEDAEDEESEPHFAASFMLKDKLRSYIYWKRAFAKMNDSLKADVAQSMESKGEAQRDAPRRGPPNKRRRVRGGAASASTASRIETSRTAGDKEAHLASLLENEVQAVGADGLPEEEVVVDPLSDKDTYFELLEMQDLIIVHPYDGDIDEHAIEEVRPRYVIMYEPEAAFIRRVEVYRSSHTDRNIRVYFMYYKDSVEEQMYLASVRREKDAFTKLIRERGNMAITIDNAKLDPEEAFLRTINTRIAGGGRVAAATAERPRVVVDTREFRSSLPSLVNARGMDVVPCMLTVGDYVLTPDICVERKSISDLIGSLNNGRLFNQAETMLEHYKFPMLLIEFDQTRSFTLDPFTDLSAGPQSALSSAPDLQSKIVLLTLAFPRMRIIWSSSPYQTAEIFEELKKLNDEPDPRKAVNMGIQEGDDAETVRPFNQLPIDMLREIPGINEKNITRLSLDITNIHELANYEEDDICAMVGREAGRQIYRFFNRNIGRD